MKVQIYTLQEVAHKTGLHADNIRQRILRGNLPAIKYGRQWFIKEYDIAKIKKNYTFKKGNLKKEI